MRNLIANFKHIFKLDPNKSLTEEQIQLICQSGTDAIVVGGTLGVTYDNVARLLKKIRKNSIVAIQEISDVNSIVHGFDYYFIPLVLNAQDPDWIINAHQKAIKKYGELINWDQVLVEGYVVLNDKSSVAKLTASKNDLTIDDVLAYVTIVDKMLKLPILYIEYSGMYGNTDWIRDIKYSVNNSQVFYGGGINSFDKAREMANYADTIIVGNVIYEDFNLALQTVINKEKQIINNTDKIDNKKLI